MKKRISTYRRFVLEKNNQSPINKKVDFDEIEPDEILDYVEVQDEPEEKPFRDIGAEFDEIMGDDEEEQLDDEFIREMNSAKINKIQERIRKKSSQLRAEKDPKKRTILNLEIQIDQLNIKHEKLR